MLSSSDIIQRGNTLKVTLDTTTYNAVQNSPEYVIGGLANFQVKVFNELRFLRFCKQYVNDDFLTYTINVTSKQLGINKNFISNDSTWQLFDESYHCGEFDLTVVMDVVPGASSFAPLHEDLELTDFELKGEDGSVRMHRAVLAASSPVLWRMLAGLWRESTEGSVDVPGTSKMTLQHFKDYVYLQTLPETGLEQLFVLAMYYMMPELEQKCAFKIVNSLTVEKLYDLLEFITKHKVPRLLVAFLKSAPNLSVSIKEILNHFLGDKNVDY